MIVEAKEELIREFQNDAKFEFEGTKCSIDAGLVSQLKYEDILECVLNASTPGSVEVLKIPGNKQGLTFNLKTA